MQNQLTGDIQDIKDTIHANEIYILTPIICPTQLQFPSTHLTYILTDLHIPSILFSFPTSPPIILIYLPATTHHSSAPLYPSPYHDLDSKELAHLHMFQTLLVDINYNP